MGEWVDFFDTDHPIYVNAAHKAAHARNIAEGMLRFIRPAAAGGALPVVLDYGCGEALHADGVAAATSRLILCEAGAHLLARLKTRFAGHPTVEVMSTEEVARMADGAVDIVVLNSVVQYLTPQETDGLFVLFRRLLRPDGRLIVGDVINPDALPFIEVLMLLRLAAANGFLFAALGGLVRTAFSPYARLRSKLKLTRYREAEMIEKLRAARFSAQRAPVNIGHDQTRMTFAARPA